MTANKMIATRKNRRLGAGAFMLMRIWIHDGQDGHYKPKMILSFCNPQPRVKTSWLRRSRIEYADVQRARERRRRSIMAASTTPPSAGSGAMEIVAVNPVESENPPSPSASTPMSIVDPLVTAANTSNGTGLLPEFESTR